MLSVYMYSVFRDIPCVKPTDRELLRRMIELQTCRDGIVRNKLNGMNVPSFPMNENDFIIHQSALKSVTEDDELLCLIFDIKQNNVSQYCLVISNGTITGYPSRAAAYRSIYNI